jgi:hypothetical protein
VEGFNRGLTTYPCVLSPFYFMIL